jgi:hypothetical protein
MNISTQGKWLAALAMAGLVATGARTARADGDDKGDKSDKGDKGDKAEGEKAEGEEGEHAEGGEKGEKKEHEEKRVVVGVDLVLGWGKVPFAVQNAPGAGPSPQTPTYSATDKTSSNVQSFVFGASAEVAEHLGVGVRVPLTFATFNPDGSASRSTAAVGNVEFEGEYGIHLGKGLKLVPALGFALPTAPGVELDPALSNATNVDQSGFDRQSLSKAAASARGYEDNALFEPHRWGIIPKLALEYRPVHGLGIEPFLKLENLVASESGLSADYVGELVYGVRVGYWIQKQFELGLKFWANTTFAGADDDKKTSAALEPQVVLRFGPVRPYAGVILPVAGPPQQNNFFGIRLGVAAAF